MQTAFGSAVFKGFVPRRDATVVKRLKDAGAILIAKATMGEFAGPVYAGSISGPILARPFEDAKLLAYAYAYEQAFHNRRPPSTTP